MDCRVKRSTRGHSGQVFADITDAFCNGQIDCCDLMSAEKDAVSTISRQLPNGDRLAGLRRDLRSEFRRD